MASKHRITVGEELRFDADVQGLKNLSGTYVQRAGGTTTTPAVIPRLNVKDFGAKGDNSTDDTAAIQAAINAATAYNFNSGCEVYFPPASYRHTGLLLKSKVILQGAGPATVLKLTNGANNHSIQLADGTQFFCSIRDLVIDGNKLQQTGTWHGLYIANTQNGSVYASGFGNPHHQFHRLIIRYHTGDGAFLDGDSFGGGVHFTDTFAYSNNGCGYNLRTPDCFFSNLDAGSNGDHGFYLLCANSRLVGCKSWYSGQVTTASDGYYMPSTSKRIQMVGCEAQDNTRHGFTFDGCQENYADGCYSDSNGTATANGFGYAFINSAKLNHVVGHTGNRTGLTTQAFGIRVDSNTNSNTGIITVGSVGTSSISGALVNNPIQIIRGIGSNRTNFVSNIEFGVDNTYDVGVSGNAPRVVRGNKLVDQGVALATGEETIDRLSFTGSQSTSSGILYLTYFTVQKSESITQLRMLTGGAAGAGLTLSRIGLFTVAANGDLTLVASTVSDTSAFPTTFTAYTRALSASYSKVAGQRYAVGVLNVGTTPPSLGGITGFVSSEMGIGPQLCGQVTAQADLPSSLTAGSISAGNRYLYTVLLP